jgi:hypothetical protein
MGLPLMNRLRLSDGSRYGLGADRIENTAYNSSFIVACISAAKETFLSVVT